jgi:hypothetical protein
MIDLPGEISPSPRRHVLGGWALRNAQFFEPEVTGGSQKSLDFP